MLLNTLSPILCFSFNVYTSYILLHAWIFHKSSSEMTTQMPTIKLRTEHHVNLWSSLCDALSGVLPLLSNRGWLSFGILVFHLLYILLLHTCNPNNILLGSVCLWILYKTLYSTETYYFIQCVCMFKLLLKKFFFIFGWAGFSFLHRGVF